MLPPRAIAVACFIFLTIPIIAHHNPNAITNINLSRRRPLSIPKPPAGAGTAGEGAAGDGASTGSRTGSYVDGAGQVVQGIGSVSGGGPVSGDDGPMGSGSNGDDTPGFVGSPSGQNFSTYNSSSYNPSTHLVASESSRLGDTLSIPQSAFGLVLAFGGMVFFL